MKKAIAGHFYAVGIGPGAPDLLTLRAVNIIQSADIIIAPRSSRSDSSLARQIIAPYLKDQQILEQTYPMEKDLESTLNSWGEVAKNVAEYCQAGKSCVQVTLGDPLIYSTSCYLLEQLHPHLPQDRIHVVPGISAMQAVASLCGQSVVIQEDRLMLMTAHDLTAVERALTQCETLVIYKCGKHIDALATLLEKHQLANKACLVYYAEHEGKELITCDLRSGSQTGYLATLIIHVGRRTWENS